MNADHRRLSSSRLRLAQDRRPHRRGRRLRLPPLAEASSSQTASRTSTCRHDDGLDVHGRFTWRQVTTARAVGRRRRSASVPQPMPTIVTLPGDGIGPEVLAATLAGPQRRRPRPDVRRAPRRRRRDRRRRHRAHRRDARRRQGVRRRAAGAVGGPKWDTTDPRRRAPSRGCSASRQGLGLYANLRPVRPLPALYDASPLKRELIEGTDLLVVRELTGGLYFGEKRAPRRPRTDTLRLQPRPRSSGSPARPSRPPRSRVTSVDKANVLETSRLWREIVTRVHAEEFPNIELEHLLVDDAAMQLIAVAAPLRRDPHREHVRRHPQRRGVDAHRPHRHAPERLARRRRAGRVRARPRHGARHRRPGDRQPARR